jgi:hypothetical protein
MDELYIGYTAVHLPSTAVEGQFTDLNGERYYRVDGYDTMSPFFISLASDSDLWMYIASTGGLTAGRKNPDTALFPYYTDDKITESYEQTGSKTLFQVVSNGKRFLWEPFSERHAGAYRLERSLAKSVNGNKLRFSERNLDLNLEFSYTWMNSDEFGWIKKSELRNLSPVEISVYAVDGLQNLLPAGIDRLTQNTYSTLVDGYKKTERIGCLALFRMEAILVDRAEPSESLRVNTVWSCGLDNPQYLLSSQQLGDVRKGLHATDETESKGVRGAYFTCAELSLSGNAQKIWYFVAEVNRDATAVNNLLVELGDLKALPARLETSVVKGTQALQELVAQADGVQQTADEHLCARHFSNVLFNTMRGGIYADGYRLRTDDYRKHLQRFNTQLAVRYDGFLLDLPAELDYFDLQSRISSLNDAQMDRLFSEYLPLTFSRRHGDPSRPWNLFSINIKDEQGNRRLSYQGNWRDIFQNWEALSLSFPGYLNGIVAKFLNATTIDGYNPYKISDEGVEWEVIEPENPWSNIGYWGDHQIVYLLRLLELSYKHDPSSLIQLLDKEQFAYAQVPYRLKTYEEIVAEPKNSIWFDETLHKAILGKEKRLGADAKLVATQKGDVLLVTFTEKLLVTLLAKLSNFIPEAGIWMNTLRPEWNDANNALVGTGASMVTLYQLRRFLTFVKSLFDQSSLFEVRLHGEVATMLHAILATLQENAHLLKQGFDNRSRRLVADALGQAGSRYRNAAYRGFDGEKQAVSKRELVDFCHQAMAYVDASIRTNKRQDGLYHAYNLVQFTEDEVRVRPLYEMLEGQVAVLSSGLLSDREAVELLDALRASALYRADQQSYMLYPAKRLPLFLEKNVLDEADVLKSDLLREMLEKGDARLISRDATGRVHFHADFKNAAFLQQALEKVGASEIEKLEVLNLYEKVFDHQSFTGRSGTFYKYEGLGCIYWHMVSKLLLAVGECVQQAKEPYLEALKQHYAAIKQGIGAHKNPRDYGSFPFDPYSHTPSMAGVQQPGMTGQVKEDILSRFFELGIGVQDGMLRFDPGRLPAEEFIHAPGGSPFLTFTYCGVPILYVADGTTGIDIVHQDGTFEHSDAYTLDRSQSRLLFHRQGGINKIIVHT